MRLFGFHVFKSTLVGGLLLRLWRKCGDPRDRDGEPASAATLESV